MKRYIKTLLLLLVVLTVSLSCEEYLDVNPELGISTDEVFTDYFSTRGALDRATRLIHNYVYNDTDWSGEVGCVSDEMQISRSQFPIHYVFNTGNWMDSNFRDLGGMTYDNVGAEFNGNDIPAEPVSKAFVAIRAVNNVLENIDKLEEFPTELGYTAQELKDQIVGQAYFLRAWHFFTIVKRYGSFPIMDGVYDPATNFDEPRPTWLEDADWMVSDLDQAINLLPVKWNDQNKGRVTKTSARAAKAMILLYASSPLMNPDLNPYGSSSKTYNIAYAEKAAAAAAEAINGYPAGGYEMLPLSEYTENWRSKNSGFPREAIVQAPLSQGTDPNGSGRAGQGWFLPQFEGGWLAENQPTQNAVDWFETIDGYDVNDPDAVTSGSFDPSDPYSNRDPRLRMDISVHGDDLYPGLPNPKPAAARTLNALPGGWHYKYEHGRNKFWAGYYSKKHKWPGDNKWHRARGWYRMFPHIRVPQLYLDYAEAVNEAYGPNGTAPGSSLTAIQAINIVRARVNMPPVLNKYTTDKETFKQRIYNERAVELYHEQHRWFDIRRWKIAKEVFAKGIWSADIKEVNGEVVYDKKPMEGAVRVFEDKHYWYPFPTKVMNMMTQFEQNPGW